MRQIELVRRYYKQLYTKEIRIWVKQITSLKKSNFQKLTQEKKRILNQLHINFHECTISSLPPQDSPGPEVFTSEFIRTFPKNNNNLLKSISENKKLKSTLYSCNEARIMLIAKHKRDISREKLKIRLILYYCRTGLYLTPPWWFVQ